MPHQVPTLQTLLTRVQADLAGFSDGTVPRASVEYALARALAGLAKGLYGYQTWAFKQQFPDTAEETYFWRWAAIFGISQNAAVPWQGTYTFAGDASTVVPAGTQVQRPDGQLYTTDAEITLDGSGEGVAELTASEPGEGGNNPDGQELQLAASIPGLDVAGTVVATVTTGSDLENPEDGLSRLLHRLANPPGGGRTGEYVGWAREVPGVTRAWEFPLLDGANSVSVAFVRDEDGTGADIVPDAGERAAVATKLETEAPITVDTHVIELNAVVVDLVFSALDPNTTAVKDAITANVTALFRREAAPGETLALSRLAQAISDAAGEESHVLDSPNTDIVLATNEIAVMGSISVL